MSNQLPPPVGTVGWVDLTVDDASSLRDFYAAVVGWTPEPVRMNNYDDYAMKAAATGQAVSGICHARGKNEGIPPVWLVYFTVADLDAGVAACLQRGGTLVTPVRNLGGWGRMAIIRDPAGAVCALSQPAESGG